MAKMETEMLALALMVEGISTFYKWSVTLTNEVPPEFQLNATLGGLSQHLFARYGWKGRW